MAQKTNHLFDLHRNCSAARVHKHSCNTTTTNMTRQAQEHNWEEYIKLQKEKKESLACDSAFACAWQVTSSLIQQTATTSEGTSCTSTTLPLCCRWFMTKQTRATDKRQTKTLATTLSQTHRKKHKTKQEKKRKTQSKTRIPAFSILTRHVQPRRPKANWALTLTPTLEN